MIWHWFLTYTGSSNVSGAWYGFWSGFGSDLSEFAVLLIVWRRFNCHAKSCYRLGLHRVSDTHFVTCRKHHPDHPGQRSVTAEEIAKITRRNRVL